MTIFSPVRVSGRMVSEFEGVLLCFLGHWQGCVFPIGDRTVHNGATHYEIADLCRLILR